MLSMTIFPQIAILGALYTLFSGFDCRAVHFPTVRLARRSIFSYLIFTLPFTVWVLTSFMRVLPGELEEAAYVDGATPVPGLLQGAAAAVAPGTGDDRPARLHRRLERVSLRRLVHPVAEQVHGAAGDRSFTG